MKYWECTPWYYLITKCYLIKIICVLLFQKLEPLNLPKLTPEMLAQKQKQADEKRELVNN